MILFPWYLVLCAAQGGLVAIPLRRRGRRRHHRMLGVVLPAIVLLTGVGTIRLLAGGAESLAWLATTATPLLAAAVGWSLGWRAPAATIPIAVTLWLLAWQSGGHIAEAARVLLVGAACLTLAAWLAALVPDPQLTLGLVLLVVVDASLVWGTHQVNPAATALHHAQLPSISFAGVPGRPLPALHGEVPSISFAGLARRPLPALQDVTLGNSRMGWVDFFAPPALGMLFTDTAPGRRRAAVSVAVAASVWGLLLLVTSPIPATVPVSSGPRAYPSRPLDPRHRAGFREPTARTHPRSPAATPPPSLGRTLASSKCAPPTITGDAAKRSPKRS